MSRDETSKQIQQNVFLKRIKLKSNVYCSFGLAWATQSMAHSVIAVRSPAKHGAPAVNLSPVGCFTRHARPLPSVQAATWPWAGNSPFRLGLKVARPLPAIDHDLTTVRTDRENKKNAPSWPASPNPSLIPLSPLQPSLTGGARRRRSNARAW